MGLSETDEMLKAPRSTLHELNLLRRRDASAVLLVSSYVFLCFLWHAAFEARAFASTSASLVASSLVGSAEESLTLSSLLLPTQNPTWHRELTLMPNQTIAELATTGSFNISFSDEDVGKHPHKTIHTEMKNLLKISI